MASTDTVWHFGFFRGGFPALGTLFGNGLIFAFAGHDTTGHTLTWMLMELCRNPDTMAKLVAEIDQFVAGKGDTPMVYTDLKELPYGNQPGGRGGG